MKTTSRTRKAGIIVIGAIWMLGVFGPAEVQAAEAHVRASAEVIDPALIDSSKILADAAADDPGTSADTAPAQQFKPQVKIVTVEGVTWLTIDYN